MRIQKEYKVQTQDIVTVMGLLDLDTQLTKEQKVKDDRYNKSYDREIEDNKIKLGYLKYLLDNSNNEKWVTISYLSILDYVSTKTTNAEEYRNLVFSIKHGWFEGLENSYDNKEYITCREDYNNWRNSHPYRNEIDLLDSYFGWKGMLNKCEEYYVKNSLSFYKPFVLLKDTPSDRIANEVRDVLIENSYQTVYSRDYSYCYYMFNIDGLDRVYKYLTNLIIEKPIISNQYFVMRKNCYKILMKKLKEEHKV